MVCFNIAFLRAAFPLGEFLPLLALDFESELQLLSESWEPRAKSSIYESLRLICYVMQTWTSIFGALARAYAPLFSGDLLFEFAFWIEFALAFMGDAFRPIFTWCELPARLSPLLLGLERSEFWLVKLRCRVS
jgi:hypothetical protein